MVKSSFQQKGMHFVLPVKYNRLVSQCVIYEKAKGLFDLTYAASFPFGGDDNLYYKIKALFESETKKEGTPREQANRVVEYIEKGQYYFNERGQYVVNFVFNKYRKSGEGRYTYTVNKRTDGVPDESRANVLFQKEDARRANRSVRFDPRVSIHQLRSPTRGDAPKLVRSTLGPWGTPRLPPVGPRSPEAARIRNYSLFDAYRSRR